MPSPVEYREGLQVLTAEAVATSVELLRRTSGSADSRRYLLLEGVPSLVGYYADGSSALAADFYDERRELAGVRRSFGASPIVPDRTVKIRRAVAWASEPLFQGLELDAVKRLEQVVQLETARPFRDTITGNRKRDPQSVGWQRISAGGCAFCRALASRGAVYKESTARFAAHPSCHCTASPVFLGGDTGPEASTLQYLASKRSRSPKEREQVRNWISLFE